MKSQEIKIQENVMLAPYTTFGLGGPARFFVEVDSESRLIEAVKYAQKNQLAVFILGGGSNILISDQGFRGLVIRLMDAACRVEGTQMECAAAAVLLDAVNLATEKSLSGFEWAAGIPGTVGGAIRGNAGAFGGSMENIVESVRTLNINDLRISEYPGAHCQFSYRSSLFKKNRNLIILSTKLNLQPGVKEDIGKQTGEIIKKRIEKQPQTVGSAGSFFENPLVSDQELIKKFEEDAKCECRGSKIPAGWLVDQVGLRGKKIGQIQVSEKHANFVVNWGGGRAEDAIILVSLIKQKIRNEFGIELRSEVEFVGF